MTLSRLNRCPSALGHVGRFGIGEAEDVGLTALHRRTAEGKVHCECQYECARFHHVSVSSTLTWGGYPSGLSHARLSIQGWTSETEPFRGVIGPPTNARSSDVRLLTRHHFTSRMPSQYAE
jgi:hypothetical protein